jgi:predicted chitinase
MINIKTRIQKENYKKLVAACTKANLNKAETAALLGNAWVETYFTHYRENLNYSWFGLTKTWPSIFKNNRLLAEELAGKPRAIANRVYANKLGNGEPESNDGWTYRGLGPLQITGATTYKNVYHMHTLMRRAAMTDVPVPQSPRLYSAAQHAEVTSVAYWLAYVRSPKWQEAAVTDIADTLTLKSICYKINKAGLKLGERMAAADIFYREYL